MDKSQTQKRHRSFNFINQVYDLKLKTGVSQSSAVRLGNVIQLPPACVSFACNILGSTRGLCMFVEPPVQNEISDLRMHTEGSLHLSAYPAAREARQRTRQHERAMAGFLRALRCPHYLGNRSNRCLAVHVWTRPHEL